MEVYAAIEDPRMPLAEVATCAQRAEGCGLTGLLIPESIHDAFLTSLLALEHTSELRVATSVALAFPRSPMITAYAAWDLQSMSGGRFALGLGSQVKGNIVGRFSTEWKPPVPRMRDYIAALRAIWDCWQRGTVLEFESVNYRFDRMQPFFAPNPLDGPPPPILLGGVNRNMTRLAGEAADGFMTHPTNTNPRYLREVINPNLEHGAHRAGRDPARIHRIASTFVATGVDAAAVALERERLRGYLGFVFSTPQYWPSLELLGWPDVGPTLLQKTRDGRWDEMAAAIPDALFNALVASAPHAEIAGVLQDWYGGLIDAVTLRLPENPADDDAFRRVVEQLRGK
jgi:probable F420-dependent oxidoreductase